MLSPEWLQWFTTNYNQLQDQLQDNYNQLQSITRPITRQLQPITTNYNQLQSNYNQLQSKYNQLHNDLQPITRWLLLGDAPRPPMFPPIFLRHLCIFLLIVAQDRVHSQLRYRSPMITWHNIPITVLPFSIFFIISLFFIILLFPLRFLVYRHASHLSRALSFSFRIPC